MSHDIPTGCRIRKEMILKDDLWFNMALLSPIPRTFVVTHSERLRWLGMSHWSFLIEHCSIVFESIVSSCSVLNKVWTLWLVNRLLVTGEFFLKYDYICLVNFVKPVISLCYSFNQWLTNDYFLLLNFIIFISVEKWNKTITKVAETLRSNFFPRWWPVVPLWLNQVATLASTSELTSKQII